MRARRTTRTVARAAGCQQQAEHQQGQPVGTKPRTNAFHCQPPSLESTAGRQERPADTIDHLCVGRASTLALRAASSATLVLKSATIATV